MYRRDTYPFRIRGAFEYAFYLNVYRGNVYAVRIVHIL